MFSTLFVCLQGVLLSSHAHVQPKEADVSISSFSSVDDASSSENSTQKGVFCLFFNQFSFVFLFDVFLIDFVLLFLFVAVATVSLEQFMKSAGFMKYNSKSMSPHAFMEQYERGCAKCGYSDLQRLNGMLLYLDERSSALYFVLRQRFPAASWEEFRDEWVKERHNSYVADAWRTVTKESDKTGGFEQFAIKKAKKLQQFLTHLSDADLIMLVALSLPPHISFAALSSNPRRISDLYSELKKLDDAADANSEEQDVMDEPEAMGSTST